jgi:hypothetical protein
MVLYKLKAGFFLSVNLFDLCGKFFIDVGAPDLHGGRHFIVIVIELFGQQ